MIGVPVLCKGGPGPLVTSWERDPMFYSVEIFVPTDSVRTGVVPLLTGKERFPSY